MFNLCFMCHHFWGFQQCRAFPGGIPNKVWRGEQVHTEPVENDNDIQFAPANPTFFKLVFGDLDKNIKNKE